MTKLINEEEAEQENTSAPDPKDIISMLGISDDKPDLRIIGIYGDINEERCAEAIFGLLTLNTPDTSTKDPEEASPEPIDFYISTYGGQASEMFAVYDMMRKVRNTTDIRTHGVGKVMSAGVLLLAAGSKGLRHIGKNCRIMIHGVVAGQHGHIPDIENEFSEIKMLQKMYIDALKKETKMTEKDLRKMMNKKTNVYIDAEKAVELGIADIIF